MADHVTCENCGKLGPRRLMRRCPEGWLFFEAKLEGTADTLIVTTCSRECADALWKQGPGERWTPEEMTLAAAPQPVKAEQDEREHLQFGATVLRVILQDALERGGEAALVPECRKWLEAERARLSAATEPKTEGGAIIRAAEGVVLEPGEYEVVEVHANDDSAVLRIGEKFTVNYTHQPTEYRLGQRGHYWQILSYDEAAKHAESTWVTAVRRVEPATDADSRS